MADSAFSVSMLRNLEYIFFYSMFVLENALLNYNVPSLDLSKGKVISKVVYLFRLLK